MTKNNNIPYGWEIKKVSELGKIVTGSTPPMLDKYNYNGNFPWVTAQDFKGKYICDSVIKLTDKGKSKSRIIPAGSVLITCIASIGLNAIAGVNMATNQQINSIIPNENTNGEFLYYLIDNNVNYLKIFAGSGGMLILSKSEFEKIKFAVPPLPEQEKIAEILSAWDKVIELLGKKIDLKSQQKKYLMQTLLTGDIRLSSFTAPWREVKLGDIGKTYSGLSGKKSNDFGSGVPFIPYMNIYQNCKVKENKLEFVNIYYNENQNVVKYGDIFFTTSSETPDEVGFSSVLLFEPNRKMYLNSFCFGFRLNDFNILLPKFASFYFRTQFIKKIMFKLAQGATRFNLSKKELMKEKVIIPTDIKEQEKIAEILTLADEEISLLKKKRELIKQQKKYLMQTLLTGQIRVSV